MEDCERLEVRLAVVRLGLGLSGGVESMVRGRDRTDGSQVCEPSICHFIRYSPEILPGQTLRWITMSAASNSPESAFGVAGKDAGGGDGRSVELPKMATARSAR